MLFSVRQKHQDLLTQLAVSVQGYLALDLIRRNNVELIKGVQRATTTTVSALRTAVIVAQALADQKLVLDQITALNTTTVEPDRVDLGDAPPAVRRRSTSRRHRPPSTSRSCRRRSPTSTPRWTRSTRSRSRRSTRCRRRSTALSTEIAKSQSYLDRVRANETRGEASTSAGYGPAVNRWPARARGHRRCSPRCSRVAAVRRRPPIRTARTRSPSWLARRSRTSSRCWPTSSRRPASTWSSRTRARSKAPRRSPAAPRPTRPGSAAATTCRSCPGPAAGSSPSRRSCSARSSSA